MHDSLAGSAAAAGPRPAARADAGFARNNFDLIRLFAALQVALYHTLTHLNVDNAFREIVGYFPGVPIFFFISGFLIYQSWDQLAADRVRTFVTNRVLRLYPALAFCFVATVASIAWTGWFTAHPPPVKTFVAWVIAQLTFVQFWNPDFLRGFGVGVANGSLWTISVELQFYLLTPLVWYLWRRHRRGMLAMFVVLVACNVANAHLVDQKSLAGKLFYVTFLPWLAMFLVGAWVSTQPALRARILRLNGWALLALYVAMYFVSQRFGAGIGNDINLPTFLVMAALVVKCAYTRPHLAERLLARNDLSYGLYIFHLPIVNLFVFYRAPETAGSVVLVLAASFCAAALSWVCVEKPALRLKRAALRRQ